MRKLPVLLSPRHSRHRPLLCVRRNTMPQCAAFSCTHRSDQKQYGESGATISFHKFPVNKPALLKQWIYKIGRSGFTPSRFAVLCSAHFSADCYEIDVYEKYGVPGHVATRRGRRLVDGAVPTLFSHAPHARIDTRGAEGQATPAATHTVAAADTATGDASSASGSAAASVW